MTLRHISRPNSVTSHISYTKDEAQRLIAAIDEAQESISKYNKRKPRKLTFRKLLFG